MKYEQPLLTTLGNLVTDFLMGEETLKSVPEQFKNRALKCTRTLDKTLLVFDILTNQWPLLPTDDQIRLFKVIVNRIETLGSEQHLKGDPSTAVRIALLKSILSSFEFNLQDKLESSSENNIKLQEALRQFSHKTSAERINSITLLRLKNEIEEIFNAYMKTGLLHSRVLLASRLLKIQTTDLKIFVNILNAELNALKKDDANSSIYLQLNTLLLKFHLREGKTNNSSKINTINDLKNVIADSFLDYAVSRENITKHPVTLLSNMMSFTESAQADARSRREKIKKIGLLAHESIKCQTTVDFQKYKEKLEKFQSELQSSHSEIKTILETALNIFSQNGKLFGPIQEFPPQHTPKSAR